MIYIMIHIKILKRTKAPHGLGCSFNLRLRHARSREAELPAQGGRGAPHLDQENLLLVQDMWAQSMGTPAHEQKVQ